MKRKSFISSSAVLALSPFIPGLANAQPEVSLLKPVMKFQVLKNSYWYIGHLMSVLLSSEETNGEFSLLHGFEVRGLEPPPHTHTREDESFYIINGEIHFTVNDEIFKATPGKWVFLPKNIQHSFQVITENAEVLMHLTPGGFEKYFIEMSVPAGEMAIPPRPSGPPDVQRIIETASKYGIKFPNR